MEMNNLSPAEGSRKSKLRVGRGIGSRGKTCGRGHKGQKSRGCLGMVGFEGGQMPLQRRVPKFGFTSKKSLFSYESSSYKSSHCTFWIWSRSAFAVAPNLLTSDVSDAWCIYMTSRWRHFMARGAQEVAVLYLLGF